MRRQAAYVRRAADAESTDTPNVENTIGHVAGGLTGRSRPQESAIHEMHVRTRVQPCRMSMRCDRFIRLLRNDQSNPISRDRHERKGQRSEPAADDDSFVSARVIWLAFIAPSEFALKYSAHSLAWVIDMRWPPLRSKSVWGGAGITRSRRP
jgi:hypothetical protein